MYALYLVSGFIRTTNIDMRTKSVLTMKSWKSMLMTVYRLPYYVLNLQNFNVLLTLPQIQRQIRKTFSLCYSLALLKWNDNTIVLCYKKKQTKQNWERERQQVICVQQSASTKLLVEKFSFIGSVLSVRVHW